MTSGGNKQPESKGVVTDGVSLFIERSVVVLALVFFVVLVVWMIIAGRPHSLELHFNPYALVSIACFISSAVALILVLRIKQKSDTLMWFSIFLLSIMAWAITEAMIRFSITPEAAAFWAPMNTLGSVVMPIALYMFALAFTDPKRARNPIIFPMIAIVSGVLLYADARTKILTVYDVDKMTPSRWGYVSDTGAAYFLIALWIILLCLAGILLLHRFRKRSIDATLRIQARLFVVAIAIPLFFGTITDGILPSLHIVVVPPMSIMFLTVSGIIICYGILKHRFISITPELIAGQILDTMNEAVIGIKPDLSLNFANAGAEKMFGLSVSKFADKQLSDFLANDWNADMLQHALFDPLKDADSHTVDSIDFHTAQGPIITTKLSINRVYDEDQPYGYLVVLTDITAMAHTKTIIEKQVADRTNELNQEHARLQAAINSIDVGLLMTFKDQAAVSYNSALPHILNIKQADSLDKQPANLTLDTLHAKLSPSKFDLKAAIDAAQQKGQPFEAKDLTYDTRILTIFGAPIMVQLDKIIGVVVLVEDVTEQKVLERSKDEFFSIASHELRTPLTSIKGNASMILDFYKEALTDPQLKEMITDVHESAVRLIEIVNDFLDTSRLEQGKMNFEYEAVNLEEVIENVAYEMKTVMAEHNIYFKLDKLTLDRLPKVWADKNRLKQVVYNLVGNGAKFTEKGGVTVSAELEDKFVKVDVIDTGRGMPLEAQKLLFHKFQQAGSSLITRDTTKGTGLGLYICKMVIESMGGHIGLDKSEEGVGSTFSFTVPVATDEMQATAKAKQSEPAAAPQTDSSTGMTATDVPEK